MKSMYRLVTLVVSAIAALGLAGNALATQKLEVSQPSQTSLTIRVSKTDADPQPARIVIYIPTGYSLALGQAPGTTIGTAEGEVAANQLGGIPVPLSGQVVVDDPAKHVTDQCAPGLHQTVWLLRLSVLNQTIPIPIYLDPTSGTETALGVAKGQLCLGPGDAADGTPLHFATFTVNGIFTPPLGATRWVGFWTPYAAGGVLNPAGTVETRSFVGPGAVSMTARVTNKRKKQVTLSGLVTQSGLGVATKVSLLMNGRAKASATSNASGRYSKMVKGTGRRATFQAKVTVGARDLGTAGCASPTNPVFQCVSASAGGFTATSKRVTVRF